MYKISDDEQIVKAYYDKIYSYTREFQLEVFLNNSQIPSNDIMALTIDTDGLNDGLTVGKIITTSVSLTVVPNHTITVKDTISINIGLKIKNPYNRRDMILNFPFGVYEINSVEVKDYNLEITCYSKGFNQLQEQFYPLGTQYTSTSLLNEISSKTGFQFEGYSDVPLMNEDMVVEGNEGQKETKSGSNFEGLTYNDIISNVASSLVSNVIFSRDGKLKFVPLSHSIQSIESLQDYTKPTTMGNTTFKKRRVEVFKREDTGTLCVGETENITALEVLQVNNPLASQSQVNQLYNTLKGVEYAHLDSVDVYLYPIHLDVLDAVTIDLNGKQHLMPICKQSIKYSNGVFATVSSYAQQSTDSYTGSLTSKVDNLGKVTSTILHEQDRIELSVSHIKENYSTKEEVKSSIEVAVGEIRLEVAETYTTKEETEELSSRLTLTAQEIRAEVKDTKDGLESLVSQTASEIKAEVKDTKQDLESLVSQTASSWSVQLNNTKSSLESSIKVNADNIALKVSKDGIISSINQSSENIAINANKINLNGVVVFNKDESGNTVKDEYITISDADYVLVYDNVVAGSFGMRDVEYDDYRIPRISLSASGFGDEGSYRNYDFFVINPYRGNKENPNGWDYPYIDIAYHSKLYDDWSNIKMMSDGMIKISALTELEIRSNSVNGKYTGTGEKLVAKFGTSSEDMYNGYLQIGAIVNTTNNNGLLLNHERVINGTTQKTSIRVHTNTNGAKTFRPSTEDGDIFCGSEGYPWYTVWSVNGHQTKSDKRYKAVTGDVDLQDCYDMVKNTNPYQYVTLSKNKDNMSQIELAEMALCNVGKSGSVNMGIMAQDILGYECSKYILSYSEEYDTYGINDYGFTTALMGALKHEIQLRDAQMKMLEDKIELLKNEIKSMRGE